MLSHMVELVAFYQPVMLSSRGEAASAVRALWRSSLERVSNCESSHASSPFLSTANFCTGGVDTRPKNIWRKSSGVPCSVGIWYV